MVQILVKALTTLSEDSALLYSVPQAKDGMLP